MLSYRESKDVVIITTASAEVGKGSFIQLYIRSKNRSNTNVICQGVTYSIPNEGITPKLDGAVTVVKDARESEVFIERTTYSLEAGIDNNENCVLEKTNQLTGEIEVSGTYVTKDIIPKTSATSTVYMFRSPITLSTSLISDQRECYVPTNTPNVYLGAWFGKRIKANAAETLTDLGLFRAGLHTWHGSLTKTGTWTTSPTGVSTGAFQATGAPYSLTAGNTISGSVTGTAAAIRTYLTTVGGYGIVSIDGDWTRANKLPAFTAADYAGGFCRESDVGKRYISSYSPATSSDVICLASDLAPGDHNIVVEVTGTKPAAATAARCYVEGFAGCNDETLGAANVYAVPIEWVYHDILNWSAFDSVTSWAPTASTDYQFLGNIHGDGTQSKEVTTSLQWLVNITDQTALASGTWASGQIIRCDHVSTLAHKSDVNTPVATRTRRWTLAANRKLPVMCDYTILWSVAGVVNIEYPVMLPIGRVVNYSYGMTQDVFSSMSLGQINLPIPSNNDNTVTSYPINTFRLIASGERVSAWAELVAEIPDRHGMYASNGASVQDRSTGDKKLYAISAFGPQPYASGSQQRFISGWGARLV